MTSVIVDEDEYRISVQRQGKSMPTAKKQRGYESWVDAASQLDRARETIRGMQKELHEATSKMVATIAEYEEKLNDAQKRASEAESLGLQGRNALAALKILGNRPTTLSQAGVFSLTSLKQTDTMSKRLSRECHKAFRYPSDVSESQFKCRCQSCTEVFTRMFVSIAQKWVTDECYSIETLRDEFVQMDAYFVSVVSPSKIALESFSIPHQMALYGAVSVMEIYKI